MGNRRAGRRRRPEKSLGMRKHDMFIAGSKICITDSSIVCKTAAFAHQGNLLGAMLDAAQPVIRDLRWNYS